MLVYIAGSGAMGSTIGYHIQKNTDSEVILLDYWDDHIRKINENGLKVSGKVEDTIKIKAMKPEEADKKADLVVVMTKSMALESMMESIEGIIGKDTQILCLLNGMGHERILEKFVYKNKINMGVTIWAAGLNAPGEIEITGKGTIDVQNIGGDEENGKKIADLLDKAGLGAKYDEDVMFAIWRKVMVNGTMNSMTSLMECTIGEFFESEESKEIVSELVKEFTEVGRAEGIKLDYEEMMAYILKSAEEAKDHYPSMYQDLIKRNRKTEIDFINGAVVEKGKTHNIATPYNKIVAQLIHAKEDIRGAK